MRPMVFSPKPIHMLFLDGKTGKGFDMNGNPVSPVIDGRRKNPTTADFLNTAYRNGAGWVMLTGAVPKTIEDVANFMGDETPEWIHGAHWIDNDATGRYKHKLSGHDAKISFARSWFSTQELTPSQAGYAWSVVSRMLAGIEPKMTTPMESPGATGAYLWGHGLNAKYELQPVDEYVAELIHSTSGQHHIEHLVAGKNSSTHPDTVALIDPKKNPTISEFAYSDGRFMYASLCSELGVGPARELRREEAADLFRERPYAKARYRVKFTVPDTWDHVGIFGVQEGVDRETWNYPNRPGATGETWADHRELIVAAKYGWLIEPLEAIQFTEKMRPMDTFANRIMKVREQLDQAQGVDPKVVKAVSAAFRNIMIHGIGKFASRGQKTMLTVDSINEVPEEFRSTMKQAGERFTYVMRPPMSDRQKSFYHPEIAAQVWGLSRARILDGPAANGHKSGALHVNPRTLIGMHGDAIYTSELPLWALPTAQGGGDDGKTGRIRLQGLLQGEMKMPVTLAQRDSLKEKAEQATSNNQVGKV